VSPFRPTILPRFKRARRRKSQDMRQSIDDCVELLLENPRHPGLHTHRVQGTRRVWESYVDYANRVTWEYGEGDIVILRNNCGHDVPGRTP
jgi:hypothetical protein